MEELQAFVDDLNRVKAEYILHSDGKIYKHENGHIRLIENISTNYLDSEK
jgi:hypothetical protein